MAKHNKNVKLKTVDEESAAESSRFFRLYRYFFVELDDLPVPKIGVESEPTELLEAATRDELKTRSNEPDIDDLIEQEMEPVEDEWETNDPSQKKALWIGLVAVGVLFSGGIIWSLMQVKDSEKRQESLAVEVMSALEKEAEEELGAETMVDSIEAVVKAFHSSRSVDELLKHVRHPERVRPLMEDYYSRHPLVPARVKVFHTLAPLTIEGSGNFWVLKLIVDTIGSTQVMVEVESNEVAKVDWESHVSYQPYDWEKFVAEGPAGFVGDFRVYVTRDYFYSYEFADSNKYASYRLEAFKSDQSLNGYVLRDGPSFKEIENLLNFTGASKVPMMLTLRVPKDGLSKRGVMIEKLIAPRWVYLE